MILLFIALAPVVIIAFYIYFRDKYEKEPIGLLLRALLFGAISIIPVFFIELYLSNYWESKFSENFSKVETAFYSAFIVAAFTEEVFKFIALYFAVWQNKNFNEKFDGIVYAVFVSLGFAAVENILYVFQNGLPTGLIRAFTAVPGHAIFGISMGYYLSKAKFDQQDKTANMLYAILIPIVLHGVYDFLLMAELWYFLLSFIPYIVFMWYIGFRKMKKHADNSVFKETPLMLDDLQNSNNSEADKI